jgi:mono/diheme cytochrome c family protein
VVVAAEKPPQSGSGSPATPPTPASNPKVAAAAVSDEAIKEAKSLFGMRCAMCHGADGSGNGSASAGLKPQPRDFRDPTWQSSVTDQHIEMAIERGGLAVGKSPLMPPNPDLVGKPVVKGLRAFIRSLKK